MFIQQSVYEKNSSGITAKEIKEAVNASIGGAKLNRVLLIPPDQTRAFSMADKIMQAYISVLGKDCAVDVLPALGTHVPMTQIEKQEFYGLKHVTYIDHDWRSDIAKVGEVPAQVVCEISSGIINEKIDVEINQALLQPKYDAIISIGQVVPHEVVGMANYTKNIVVGCGGSMSINASHYIGAIYGLEKVMGKDYSPVRRLFDYIEGNILVKLPLCYALSVTTEQNEKPILHGLFIGRERTGFESAVVLSQQKNITFVEKPFKKVVVFLDPKEFKSTWLGNKAIYRTRMAIADGGELIILAPGVERFGEDETVDKLIRKYGYCGTPKIIELCKSEKDLQENLSAAAHLIHGSSEGRFKITYCTQHLNQDEIERVGFNYMPYSEVCSMYENAVEGYNVMDSNEFYYIGNPAIGLWADRARF